MDELLYERVKQLREIHDRITMALRNLNPTRFRNDFVAILREIEDMILAAEKAHAEF